MPKGKRINVEWLREHYPMMTDINRLLDDYEAEFGHRPTKTAVYVKANKLGIKKVPVAGRHKGCERMIYWSREPEMEAWMLEHEHGQRIDVLSDEFRERFGFALSRGQIDRFRANHGRQTRKSHSGGRTLLPVGTERVGKDGYVVVKVREEAKRPLSKDNWILKHVWIWEQAHGPLPKDHCVFFADGDKANFDPENLVAVPRRIVGVMNSLRAQGTTWQDAETLRAVMALAELRVARNRLVASEQRVCPCCGKRFDNLGRLKRGNISSTVCPECGAAGRRPPLRKHRKYDHDEIRRMHAEGYANYQIVAAIGCTPSTVYNVLRDVRKEGKA